MAWYNLTPRERRILAACRELLRVLDKTLANALRDDDTGLINQRRLSEVASALSQASASCAQVLESINERRARELMRNG